MLPIYSTLPLIAIPSAFCISINSDSAKQATKQAFFKKHSYLDFISEHFVFSCYIYTFV